MKRYIEISAIEKQVAVLSTGTTLPPETK